MRQIQYTCTLKYCGSNSVEELKRNTGELKRGMDAQNKQRLK